MKKLITTITLILLGLFSKAQSIPNEQFSNWTMSSFGWWEPNNYKTTDSIIHNILPSMGWMGNGINRDSSSTLTNSFPWRVSIYRYHSTQQYQGNYIFTLPVICTNGNIDNNFNVSGGIPFYTRPDSISYWMGYSTTSHDTSYISITLKKNGHIIGYINNEYKDNKYSTGPIFGNFEHYKINYITNEYPDELLLEFGLKRTSSLNNAASYFSVDDIKFSGTNTPITNPNSVEEIQNITLKDSNIRIFDMIGKEYFTKDLTTGIYIINKNGVSRKIFVNN